MPKVWTVADLLAKKKDKAISYISSETQLDLCAEKLWENPFHALVVKEGSEILGLVTEGPLTKIMAKKPLSWAKMHAQDIMSTNLVCVKPKDSLEACITSMQMHQMNWVLVRNSSSLLAVVSETDLVDFLMDQAEGPLPSQTHSPRP